MRERVLLFQLDGKLPNVALMRIAAHHRAMGDDCELRYATTSDRVQRHMGDSFGKVYASAVFQKTRPVVEEVRQQWPGVLVGGTGIDETITLEAHGITTTEQDYSLYPSFAASIGFLRRGCRLRCGFCVVPRKEGAVRDVMTVADLWRGDPWPKHLHLLDNDFFGGARWQQDIEDIRSGGFKVSFNQGINARMLNDETAAAIASIDYRDDSFKVKRIYTAWDNRKDERRLFDGLEALVRRGVKPDHIMVYMLVGYWPGETHEDRDYRRAQLRAFGARPYPMPFQRTHELIGFQRWVIGAYDKKIPWPEWARANYEPRNLGRHATTAALFRETA